MPNLSNFVGVRGPAFRAYSNGIQPINTASSTKVSLSSESFDTNNCYNITLSRFTPIIAGYYQINAALAYNSPHATAGSVQIWKNGAVHSQGAIIGGAGATQNTTISDMVSCNGTTDFIEIYTYHSTGAAKNIGGGETQTYFSGCLIRAA